MGRGGKAHRRTGMAGVGFEGSIDLAVGQLINFMFVTMRPRVKMGIE